MKSKNTTKKGLAKKLGIARSSLYYKPKKPPKDEELKLKILKVMEDHKAYGHRRISTELKVNKKAVIRIMKNNGLKPKIHRKFPFKPDDQDKPETHMINILKILCPLYPNMVWAGDFTYFRFMDKFWYLATVIDVRTREIMGWHIANHHTTSLIVEALKDAVKRSEKTPVWFHSDQGSEYVSGIYYELLKQYNIKPSHSKKSSPWQNGYQESFYSNFKLELGDLKRFTCIGELIEAIHQQIDYYNNRRIHSALKKPPVEFRIHQTQKKQISSRLINKII
jgi:putative transposase